MTVEIIFTLYRNPSATNAAAGQHDCIIGSCPNVGMQSYIATEQLSCRPCSIDKSSMTVQRGKSQDLWKNVGETAHADDADELAQQCGMGEM